MLSLNSLENQQRMNPVYSNFDWLSHYYFPSNSSLLAPDIARILKNNQEYFQKALIYLDSDQLLLQVNGQLEYIPKLKSSIVVINSSHNLMERKRKFQQATLKQCRVLLTSVSVQKSFQSKIIDIQYMNLIINSKIPSSPQQYKKRVQKSRQLSLQNKGVVISCFDYRKESIEKKYLNVIEAKLKIKFLQYRQYTTFLKNDIIIVQSKKGSPYATKKQIDQKNSQIQIFKFSAVVSEKPNIKYLNPKQNQLSPCDSPIKQKLKEKEEKQEYLRQKPVMNIRKNLDQACLSYIEKAKTKPKQNKIIQRRDPELQKAIPNKNQKKIMIEQVEEQKIVKSKTSLFSSDQSGEQKSSQVTAEEQERQNTRPKRDGTKEKCQKGSAQKKQFFDYARYNQQNKKYLTIFQQRLARTNQQGNHKLCDQIQKNTDLLKEEIRKVGKQNKNIYEILEKTQQKKQLIKDQLKQNTLAVLKVMDMNDKKNAERFENHQNKIISKIDQLNKNSVQNYAFMKENNSAMIAELMNKLGQVNIKKELTNLEKLIPDENKKIMAEILAIKTISQENMQLNKKIEKNVEQNSGLKEIVLNLHNKVCSIENELKKSSYNKNSSVSNKYNKGEDSPTKKHEQLIQQLKIKQRELEKSKQNMEQNEIAKKKLQQRIVLLQKQNQALWQRNSQQCKIKVQSPQIRSLREQLEIKNKLNEQLQEKNIQKQKKIFQLQRQIKERNDENQRVQLKIKSLISSKDQPKVKNITDYFLVESDLFEEMTEDEQSFLFKSVVDVIGKKRIIKTKKLFSASLYQPYFDNWLDKISNRPKLLLLVRLENKNIIGGFCQDYFTNTNEKTYQKGKGCLFSVTNKKIYQLKVKHYGNGLKHDRYLFGFGNNQLLIKSNMTFSTVFNKAFCYYDSKTEPIQNFLGSVNDEGKYEKIQFYQIFSCESAVVP